MLSELTIFTLPGVSGTGGQITPPDELEPLDEEDELDELLDEEDPVAGFESSPPQPAKNGNGANKHTTLKTRKPMRAE